MKKDRFVLVETWPEAHADPERKVVPLAEVLAQIGVAARIRLDGELGGQRIAVRTLTTRTPEKWFVGEHTLGARQDLHEALDFGDGGFGAALDAWIAEEVAEALRARVLLDPAAVRTWALRAHAELATAPEEMRHFRWLAAGVLAELVDAEHAGVAAARSIGRPTYRGEEPEGRHVLRDATESDCVDDMTYFGIPLEDADAFARFVAAVVEALEANPHVVSGSVVLGAPDARNWVVLEDWQGNAVREVPISWKARA